MGVGIEDYYITVSRQVRRSAPNLNLAALGIELGPRIRVVRGDLPYDVERQERVGGYRPTVRAYPKLLRTG